MLYKLTAQGKEAYKELEQGRGTLQNPNVTVALQAAVSISEDDFVSENWVQRELNMDLVEVRQLMSLLVMLHLIEPATQSVTVERE